MARMKTPRGTSMVSFGGARYDVAPDGYIEVPEEAVDVLIPHGFAVAPKEEEIENKVRRGRPRAKPKAPEATI